MPKALAHSETGPGEPATAAIDELPFRRLFAGIPLSTPVLELPPVRGRARNALERQGVRTFEDLADWTIASLRALPRVGESTVDTILFALQSADEAASARAVADTTTGPRARSTRDSVAAWYAANGALRSIAGWSAARLSGDQSLLAALDAVRTGEAPEHIRHSVLVLEHVSVRTLVPEAEEASASVELRDWIASLDTRQFAVLAGRILATEAVSLLTIAEELSLTRERVRQIEMQTRTAGAALFEPSWSALLYELTRITDAVTGIALVHDVPSIDLHVATLLPSVTLSGVEILLRLSGAGDTDGRFVGVPGLAHWRTLTRQVLDETLATSGTLAAVRERLVSEGISGTVVDEWLTTFDIVVAGDVMLPQPRTLADRVHAVLLGSGEPQSLAQIAAVLEGAHSTGSLRNALVADERFVRAGPSRWALAQWGTPVFKGSRHAMFEELKALGGKAPVKELAELLHRKYGIAKGTVRVYAGESPFRFRDGIVSIG